MSKFTPEEVGIITALAEGTLSQLKATEALRLIERLKGEALALIYESVPMDQVLQSLGISGGDTEEDTSAWLRKESKGFDPKEILKIGEKESRLKKLELLNSPKTHLCRQGTEAKGSQSECVNCSLENRDDTMHFGRFGGQHFGPKKGCSECVPVFESGVYHHD